MVVQVQGARKAYGAVRALAGVDLAVRPGALHGLLGPNGAGKTTLLRMLLGLVRPDAGSVEVLDAPAAPGRAGVAGFVDAPRAWPYLTGRRTLQLLARLDGGDAGARLAPALERVGLAGSADTRVSGWSTGQRQRLGLAAALLRAPRVLVLDEPTSGLDPVGVAAMHDLLRELSGAGTTVVLSSHDLSEVAALCTEVTVVAGGTVRFDGTLAALRAQQPAARHRLRTSDDPLARQVGGDRLTVDGADLLVTGPTDELVLALAARGVAVRSLTPDGDPLALAFAGLTS